MQVIDTIGIAQRYILDLEELDFRVDKEKSPIPGGLMGMNLRTHCKLRLSVGRRFQVGSNGFQILGGKVRCTVFDDRGHMPS